MTESESLGSLWRGSLLTVNMVMIVTTSQLATYDHVNEGTLNSRAMADGLGTHVTSNSVAGIMATVASNPVDVMKTRVMNMKVGDEMKVRTMGALDCVVKTRRSEGMIALYKGFIPTLSRQGPFPVVLFVTLEQVRKLLKNFCNV